MKSVFFILFICITTVCFSQTAKPKSDKANEYTFRRQVMELKEYRDEKAKLPRLRKMHPHIPVKVIVGIEKEETGDEDETPANILTGYIKEVTGADTTNAYEIQFDEKEQKIISVKNTGESTTQDEGDEDEKAPKSKPYKKKTDDDNTDNE